MHDIQELDKNLHLGSANIICYPIVKGEVSSENSKVTLTEVTFYQSKKVETEKFYKPISKILKFEI